MIIDILTLFPEMFGGPFSESILRRAQDKSLVEINIHNLRDWAEDKHKTVDDRPYGGGAGMVLRVDVIDRALSTLKSEARSTKFETNPKFQIPTFAEASVGKQNSKQKKSTINNQPLTILLSAKGKLFTQKRAFELSKYDHLIFVAGHYEGVDERVAKHLVDEEISIGNYVLTGGEIPAMVITDTVVRLIPGVLNPESLAEESHSQLENGKCLPAKASAQAGKMENYTEYPQYTRPENYKGWKVPEILLSGNHKEIEKWRKKKI